MMPPEKRALASATENSMRNDCKAAVPEKTQNIYPAAIVAAIFVLACSFSPGGGFLAFFLLLPLAFWAFFQVAHAIFLAEARKFRLLRVGVWLLAFALVIGIHLVRDRLMRQEAEAIVVKIQAYHAQYGTCPPTLESIGESRKNFREKLGGVYVCEEGRLHLSYRVPYNGFDRYHYDFERQAWDYVPD
jgi:hypothetical protein